MSEMIEEHKLNRRYRKQKLS